MTPGSNQYHNLHQWLNRHFKSEKKECAICFSKERKLDWALRKGFEYERKRVNFVILCKSCHSRYDFKEETRKKLAEAASRTLNGFKKGHKKYPPKDKEAFRAKMRAIALADGRRPPKKPSQSPTAGTPSLAGAQM